MVIGCWSTTRPMIGAEVISTGIKTECGFDWKITLMGYGCGLVIGFSLRCLIFLSEKPEWLVQIIDENIHKKIIRYKMSTRRRGEQRS